MEIKEELEFVKKQQKDMTLISQAASLLNWDEETYMPKDAIEGRSEQMSFLSGLIHEKATDEKFFKAIEKLKNSDLEGDNKIMIERLHHDITRQRKLPAELVKELAKAKTIGSNKWREAKATKDFNMFLPYLEKIVELSRKKAAYLGENKYDALLEGYEEGMTSEKIKSEFEKLKTGLIELLRKIEFSEAYKNQSQKIFNQKFDKDKQLEISKDIVKRIGLGENNSRMDLVEHPFETKIGKNDVRITTGIRENAMFAIEAAIHEAGHGIYELNMPDENLYDALGDAPSHGLHESQSRFWENMISKNKHFWNFYFLKFKETFNIQGTQEEFYKELNQVKKGKIRIESDEVHYCLHIILRFELESALINGTIEPKDLPKLWNKKMKEYFDIEIENDSEGVMQDVHWSNAYFGYFPTYALGTIYAAQIFDAMKKDIDIESEIAKGDYKKIRNWLKEKIHSRGKRILADDLIKQICGEGLNVQAFLDYLNEKYSEIYKI